MEDDIDSNVGIVLSKKVVDFVNESDELLKIYRNKPITDDILSLLDDAYVIVQEKVKEPDTIQEIIG